MATERKEIHRIGILTGGGDCPGLNAVIRVVTKAAINKLGIEVLGIEDGYLGLIRNRIRPLGLNDVSNILTCGGTIRGYGRTRLKGYYRISGICNRNNG